MREDIPNRIIRVDFQFKKKKLEKIYSAFKILENFSSEL